MFDQKDPPPPLLSRASQSWENIPSSAPIRLVHPTISSVPPRNQHRWHHLRINTALRKLRHSSVLLMAEDLLRRDT